MKYEEIVNRYIESLPYDRKPRELYEPIKYVLSMGGKRIRPVLMLMAYSIYRDNPETILPEAVALETYHNFTLLHDDLMDNADVRRGKPTVHKKWDANTAILSGDTMLVLAFKRMMEKCPADKLGEVLNTFTVTALEIDEGQQYDIDFETRNDVREEEYIEMIRLKTSVLLACAMKIGAILADAPAGDAEKLYHFGEQIGLAFQLQDDLLDVYGDPKVFGKTIGGDILCNKKTFMLINAFNRADEATRKELNQWISISEQLAGDKALEKINAVTGIYNKLGIRELCEDKINSYFAEAESTLESLKVAEEKKVALRSYMNELLHRNK